LSLFSPWPGPVGPGASLSVAPDVGPGHFIRQVAYSETGAETRHQARGQNCPDPWVRPNPYLRAGRP